MRTPATIAVLLPYWTFWEASAGGESFRAERQVLLEELVTSLDAAGTDVAWAGLVDSDESGEAAAREIRDAGAQLAVVVQSMAVPPSYAKKALDGLPELPVVVWAAQSGSRLRPEFDASDITRLGATVGTPMITNVLGREGRTYQLVVGAVGDESVLAHLGRVIRAAAVAGSLATSRIARIGGPIPGYACVDVNDEELRNATGIEVVSVEPVAVRNAYLDVADVDALEREVRNSFEEVLVDADSLDRSLKLAAALERLDEENAFDAGAMNCHVPEIRFGDDPGITPCFALGRETTRGIPWTCVGDVVTAVAMLVAKRLGGAALYHELEAIDFETGEVAIANSGEHDLAWCAQGCRSRLQPNPWFLPDARTGASAWYELPAGPATLVGFTPRHDEQSGFRLIAAEGTITGRAFPDSPTVGGAFRFAGSEAVAETWSRWADSGVNHHSAAAPGHLADQVAAVAHFLGIGFVQVS